MKLYARLLPVFIFGFLATLTEASFADLREIEVAPALTSPALLQMRGAHRAWSDPAITTNGLLLVAIGGTQSQPSDLREIGRAAVALGYRAVAVDYADAVSTMICREHPAPECFEQFHQTIVLGEKASAWAKVDPGNGIENRLLRLIQYLARTSPAEWSTFLNGDDLAWEKIVLISHSQGTGHAAFIAKRHAVVRVVLLAGPQDVSTLGVAPWLQSFSTDGQTPISRIRVFLHKADFFDSTQQLRAARAMIGKTSMDPVMVMTAPPSDHDAQILMSQAPQEDPHNSLIRPVYRQIWERLLERADRI